MEAGSAGSVSESERELRKLTFKDLAKKSVEVVARFTEELEHSSCVPVDVCSASDSSCDEASDDGQLTEGDTQQELLLEELKDLGFTTKAQMPFTSCISQLADVLMLLKEQYNQSLPFDQAVLADEIAKLSNIVPEYYALAFNIFQCTNGLSSDDGMLQLYLLLMWNIEGWVNMSSALCKELVSRGMLLQNLHELDHLGLLHEYSQELLSVVETNLSIVYNCSRHFSLPNFYLCNYPWSKLLSKWGESPNSGIRITCKLLAATVQPPLLSSCPVQVSESDLEVISSALISASLSSEAVTEAFGYQYSSFELLSALKSFSLSSTNLKAIANPVIISPLIRFINLHQTELIIASLKLLCCLFENEPFRSIAFQSKELLSSVKMLKENSKNEDVVNWANCMLLLQNPSTLPQESIIALVKSSYALQFYERCVRLCGNIPGALIFRAKSLYHLYQKEQQRLRTLQKSLPKKEFFISHKECYAKAKEVVKILGQMIDNKLPEIDRDCCKMLDFAMLDFLLETNKLKELKRCFLCLKRQLPHSEIATAEEVVTTQKAPLCASHLVPNAVIKMLARDAAQSVGSKKVVVFGTFGTKSDKSVSPSLCTLHMLCRACEHNLNHNGEFYFLQFFEKLYSNPDAYLEHGYGKELYHFCVGIIFRTLCPSQSDYLNCEEVYNLLVQSRHYLQGDKGTDPPEIYILACPTKDSDFDDKMEDFIAENCVSFTSKISLDCPLSSLGTFESTLAHFFMVKVGTIIVIVKFNPSAKHSISKDFLVSPHGGKLVILQNSVRKSCIPTGVWTVLHILFERYKKDLQIT